MNKKHKIWLNLLTIPTGIIALSSIPVVLTSCGNNDSAKGIFYRNGNDPYKELTMLARSLDYAYFKDDQSRIYEKKANDINNLVKDRIKTLSTNLSQYTQDKKITKHIEFKNKSIVFLKSENPKIQANDTGDVLLSKLNKFHMEQPILYSSIYSDANNQDIPGLGLSFPAPIDPNGLRLFDNWFEIGAAAFDSGNQNIPIDIAKAWKGTSDIVVYLYDSSALTPQEEIDLVDKIWNMSDKDKKNFLPHILLNPNSEIKSKSGTSNVIPLDIQFFYNPIFSVYGTAVLTDLFVNLLADLDDGNLGDDFGGITTNFKSRSTDFNPLPEKIQNFSTPLTTISPEPNTSPIKNYISNSNGSWTNLLSTAYNVSSQLASIGILANYYIQLNDNTSFKCYDLPGILKYPTPLNTNPMIDKNMNTSYTLLQTDFLKSQPTEIQKKQIYSIGADRSHFPTYGKDFSFTNPFTPYNKANAVSPRNTDANGYDSFIDKGIIKTCFYTERNDTDLTQSTYVLNILENTKTMPLMEYYNKNKYYVNIDPVYETKN